MNDERECWPSWEQELLLKAALLQGTDAISAWEKWKSVVDTERLDPGSYKLLPLLYNNLNKLGIKDPLMSKLKRVYLQTWYKNQLWMHRAGDLLNSFHCAGIKTMVLKGTALILLYYRNHGFRPMSDIDVLVRSKQAHQAIESLMESGWVPELESPQAQIPISHGVAFKNPDTDLAIDLHWHVIHECCQANADDKFWEGAISVDIGNITTHALSPADQLLHTIVHGIKWDPTPPIRWVADSMAVINHSNSHIDWKRLILQSKEHRLILPVRDALSYLSDKLDARIPEGVLKTIQNLRTTRMERIEYKYKTQNYLQKPLGYMPIIWFDYSRRAGSSGLPLKVIGFLKYMRSYWGVQRLWRLPFYAVSMAMRRIKAITDYYRKQTK